MSEPDGANDLDPAGYRQLVERGPELTAVLDRNDTIRYVNQTVQDLLGREPASLTGTEIESVVHSADRNRLKETLATAREDATTAGPAELRFDTADGSWTELATIAQYRADENALDGVVLTMRSTDGAPDQDRDATSDRMELALEGANVGIWDWDMRTDRVERDELLTEMLGYTPDEMGDHIDDWAALVHPEGRRRHDEALADHVENRTPFYECEYRLRTNSGDWKWVRTIGKVVEWDDGEPARAVGIHQDVDDRKRAELALEAERDLFRAGPAMVFTWRDEPGWPIETASENVADILGYSPAELEDGQTPFATLVHEDDLDRLEAEVAEQAGQKRLNPSPYRVRTADGGTRWVMEYTRRLHDSDEKTRLRGYLVDITDRKQREEKYRNLFEGARDAIMVFDRDGYLDCNERTLELFGFESSEDFLQQTPWELSPTTQPDGRDSKAASLEYIERAFEEGEAFFEWTHQRTDGTTFPSEVKLSRFEYGGDAVLHALIRDISERKAQQEELAAERNRIRAITNAIPDVTIVYDRTGQYRDVLAGQEALLSEAETELVGKNVRDVLAPDMAATIRDGIENSLETDSVQTVVYSVVLEAEQRWFEGRIAPIPGGDRDEVVLLARDITDRKAKERELEEREAKYRSLFEDTRDALMLLDRDGFFDCNERTLELFGVDSVADFSDLTPWDLSPAAQPDGTDSTSAARAHIERAFEEGEAFFEWTHQRLDGTEFPCEVKLSKFTVDGEPALHALVRDITERKANERALEAARAELREIVDLIPDPVFAKTRSGEYLLANEATATVFGTTVDAIEGSAQGEVVPNADDAEAFREADRRVIDSGEPEEIIEEVTTAAGERRIYQTIRIPFEPSDAEEPAALGYARDVTELKEYEAELESQRDNLEVLNTVVRHDIRNDLQLVLAYAQTLEDRVDGEAAEFLDRILEAATDAIDITRTARDVTEILLESDADPRPLALAPVLEEEVTNVQDSRSDSIVTLDRPLPSAKVMADDMLHSVFRNVLQNAIAHNDKPVPNVAVSATREDGAIIVEIADNGPGVPPDRAEAIFEEGVQGIDSEGTGLGLYLVDTLVTRYGGDVRVEENDPEGAIFVLRFPIAETG